MEKKPASLFSTFLVCEGARSGLSGRVVGEVVVSATEDDRGDITGTAGYTRVLEGGVMQTCIKTGYHLRKEVWFVYLLHLHWQLDKYL